MDNALCKLLDHEIGAAVQPAEPGSFFGTIFPALREPKKWPCGTLSQLFMLAELGYPEEMRTSM